MATYQIEQIKEIIVKNPNKALLAKAQEKRTKLMMHLHGVGMKENLSHMDYFENTDIYKARKQYALSNKDFFARILNEEDQVFTARDGSVSYSLPEGLEKEMNGLTEDVRYGVSLHNWVRTFGLNAYRSDPMGVVFMEREQSQVSTTGFSEPKCYPTYKASTDIYDYDPNGRRLEHICFQLTVPQLAEYGVKDDNYKSGTGKTDYFRFVDDAQDTIYKRQGDSIVLVTGEFITQANPIKNTWSRVPAFIISDLMQFDDPKCFATPVEMIVELADSFLYDRSIRDLQKKYHGFAKAFEPLLGCGDCAGTGLIDGTPCLACTPAGADKGTGFRMRSKIADIAKVPIKILTDVPGFDWQRLFGYVTPDIESWNKQDTSLEAIEQMSYYTYWGVSNTSIQGFNGTNKDETATKTLTNLQPKYARLNSTADWAEKTEKMIADFIGEYWFEDKWKGASYRYGRNYILETPEQIMATYQDMIGKGSPDSVKDEQVRKYIRSLYQNSPIQQAKFLKLFAVEPFPHNKPSDIESSTIIPLLDKLCKRYYGEWIETLQDGMIISQDEQKLRDSLIKYAQDKQAKLQPELDAAAKEKENQPSFGKN